MICVSYCHSLSLGKWRERVCVCLFPEWVTFGVYLCMTNCKVVVCISISSMDEWHCSVCVCVWWMCVSLVEWLVCMCTCVYCASVTCWLIPSCYRSLCIYYWLNNYINLNLPPSFVLLSSTCSLVCVWKLCSPTRLFPSLCFFFCFSASPYGFYLCVRECGTVFHSIPFSLEHLVSSLASPGAV